MPITSDPTAKDVPVTFVLREQGGVWDVVLQAGAIEVVAPIQWQSKHSADAALLAFAEGLKPHYD